MPHCLSLTFLQKQHSAKINDVSLDLAGDYVASCSDDGKVVVRSLYDRSQAEEYTFDRPVKVGDEPVNL